MSSLAAFQLWGVWPSQVKCLPVISIVAILPSFSGRMQSKMLPWLVSKSCLVKSASFGLWAWHFVDKRLQLAAARNTEGDELTNSAFYVMESLGLDLLVRLKIFYPGLCIDENGRGPDLHCLSYSSVS